MSLSPGQRIGGYEILSSLGAGGMGEVYRARDVRLGRQLAIKTLPADLIRDPAKLERFELEARSASSLNHPNIITIYEIGTEDGVHFIAMELVEGQCLRELIARGPLDRSHLLGLAGQIADGLATAHAAGIVHRDLKPENIMVNRSGLLKILDFGLAKLTGSGGEEASSARTVTRLTSPNILVGTLAYMSPEQLRGQPIDHRSDQFAVGSILYELGTGRGPFERATPAETQAAIMNDEAPPLRKRRSDLAELSAVVERCLAKDPSGRYVSTEELALEMKRIAGRAEREGKRHAPFPRVLAAAVLLFVILGAGVLFSSREALLNWMSPGATSFPIDSIAVLPLDNLSGNPDEEYFADGMTEALIAELAQVRALKVISRTSVMRYKDDDARSVPEIARALGVKAVVEGSALRVGDQVRITVQLIEAETDQHLWARSYQRDLRDVLALQDEIARTISNEIAAELTASEEQEFTQARTVDPEAYEAYLKGWYFWHRVTPESVQRSVELFQEATELDPTYAPAFQGLSAAYHLAASGNHGPDDELYPKAKQAVEKALALDPELASAHASLGFIQYNYNWDWAAAERSFARAIELEPNNVWHHHTYALYLRAMGRPEESVRELERALELDPLDLLVRENLGWTHLFQGQYDEALRTFEEVQRMEPGRADTSIAWAFLLRGETESAIAMLEQATSPRRGDIYRLYSLGVAYARGGRVQDAKRSLETLIERGKTQYVSPSTMAQLYTALGDRDAAFTWLERAYLERDDSLVELSVFPIYETLRGDERFVSLVRRIGLPAP